MKRHVSPVQQTRWQGEDVVIKVVGEIDLEASPIFQQALLALLDRRPARMIVDLAGVPYMDSSGVASLVKLLSRARRTNSDLRLVALSERTRNLLEITRLDRVFSIYATEAEALA